MTKTGRGWQLLRGAVLLAGMWLLVWGIDRAGGQREDREARDEKEARVSADLACISPAVEGFVSLHVAELWDNKALASVREKLAGQINKDLHFQKEMGVAVEQIERVSFVAPSFQDMHGGPVILLATRRPYDRDRVLVLVGDKPKKETVGERTVYTGTRAALCPLDDRAFAFGPPDTLRHFLEMAGEKKEGPLSGALKMAGEKHLLVQAANWEPLTKLLRNQGVPPQLEPYKALLETHTSLLVVDFDDKVKADLKISFAGEDEAGEALKPIRGLVQMANKQLAPAVAQMKQHKEAAPFLKQVEAIQTGLNDVSVERKGKTVQIQGSVAVDPNLGPMALDLVQKTRAAAMRSQSTNNLKQIALSMHNYNDSFGQLPAQAIYSKDGKPLLSWRVAILPFIEQDNLYKKFHLDEPWDSEHNKKLMAQMPRTYASPVDPEGAAKHHTHYLGFFGPGAFFEGKKGLKLPASFPDGTSNTIMVVETSQSVPWTKPEDLPFDPEKDLPKLGGLYPGGFLAAMCDGSVRFVSKTVSKETLKNAINRMDGQPLGSDW